MPPHRIGPFLPTPFLLLGPVLASICPALFFPMLLGSVRPNILFPKLSDLAPTPLIIITTSARSTGPISLVVTTRPIVDGRRAWRTSDETFDKIHTTSIQYCCFLFD
jgi:hypothetical protein